MTQLHTGAVADVAGQQADQHVLTFAQTEQQFRHAGQHAAGVPLQARRQMTQIGRGQPPQVVRRLVDDVHPEQVAEDGPVGAAAELELFDQVRDAEFLG